MSENQQEYPPVRLNENARVVLEKRYFKQDASGSALEDARGLFMRVASAIAAEEKKYVHSSWDVEELQRAFYSMMAELRFLPNSPTLMNAGTKLGQLSACFVLPVGDSIEEIFDSIKHAAMIHKSGGGTGFSFSRLRPKDSRVGTTGGVASGPVSFMKIFNTATEQIKQGGTRRGANMGILRVDHPDILEFIGAKDKEGEFNNFNLSVGLTDEFMEALKADREYGLIDPHSGQPSGWMRATEVFDRLVLKAWESGDPGIVFLDRINHDNPTPGQGEIEATNPCGEQPLLPYEACNLGSINLSLFCLPDKTGPEAINWQGLRETIFLAVRFLDNVIDASRFPLERITENVRNNRKIGLGVMGWADLLYRVGLPYDGDQAVALAEKVMAFIQEEGHAASRLLARERGAFPAFSESVHALGEKPPLRNATVTTIAPTGTLSIIAGCSSGIEPLFALSFSRHILDGETLTEVNPWLQKALEEADIFDQALMEEVARSGRVRHMEDLPGSIREVFATAMDIEPEWHLRMQAAFQKFTDNAVSKTVNLPNDSTPDDIRTIYLKAHELGCKGITVYRDGSKSVQVLYAGKDATADLAEPECGRTVLDRPDTVFGFTQKVRTGHGQMYVTINEIDGRPFEVFATIGKSGRSITAKAEAVGRLISLALRSGIQVDSIVKQIKGIGGEAPVFQTGKNGQVQSIPDAIAWVLENRYLKDASAIPEEGRLGLDRCPDCEEPLVFQEGCMLCPACAFTRCG